MAQTPKKEKPTSNPRQAWVTVALVIIVSGLFGLIVLPRIGPRNAGHVGAPAPDFALEVISGGEPGNRIRLSDQLGKPVVIDFWASWCGPCREQAPIIDAFAKSHADSDVVVMGVATDDQKKEAIRFTTTHELTYPCLYDLGSRVAANYGVKALPTVVVVDVKGAISAVRSHVVTQQELGKLVEAARNP